MTEIVDFLRDPETFTRLGAKAPKGALMVGPPGVGKTLLARAVAGETHSAFIAVSGADFRQTFMGLGANKVRNMFKLARKNAPCLIFIDEIETLARKRSGSAGSGINSEEEATLNALLVEMDGFVGNKGVVVLAATNRPDLIDSAVLRPGRFDRRINLEIPDLTGRIGILKVHARNKVLAGNVDLEIVARRTTGMSGADLENLLNEAAIRGTKRAAPAITMDDIDGAYFDVLLGRVRNGAILRDDDRRAIAVHEAGHAIAAATVEGAKRPQKATIVPRGRALGVVLSTPIEDRKLVSRQQLMGDIVVCLAGRAAELKAFGAAGVSTGAEDDFKQATSLASRMASLWSMATSTPVLSITEDSSTTARQKAEERAQTIIDDAWTQALETLDRHKNAHAALVVALLEREIHRGRRDRGDRARACGFAAAAASDPRRRVATRRSSYQVKRRDVGRRGAVAARRLGKRGVRQPAMQAVLQNQQRRQPHAIGAGDVGGQVVADHDHLFRLGVAQVARGREDRREGLAELDGLAPKLGVAPRDPARSQPDHAVVRIGHVRIRHQQRQAQGGRRLQHRQHVAGPRRLFGAMRHVRHHHQIGLQPGHRRSGGADG